MPSPARGSHRTSLDDSGLIHVDFMRITKDFRTISDYFGLYDGRGGGIRTPDPLLPKQMRYQAALRPDICTVSRNCDGPVRSWEGQLSWRNAAAEFLSRAELIGKTI